MNKLENIFITPMKSEHIDGIILFESLSFSVPWSKTMFEEELCNEKAIYFVALCRDIVVGYIGMWKILDEGHITNVAVHPDFRRMKIGDLLIKELISWSSQNAVLRMTLEVRKSNIPAIGLYSRNEFENCGIRKKYYPDNNEDAVIMWKNINIS